MDSLSKRTQFFLALGVLLLLGGAVWGIRKWTGGERPYHIHLTGSAEAPTHWKVPPDFFSKMTMNVSLEGVPWVVGHDNTVWERINGRWAKSEKTAKMVTKIETDGKYALDIDISLLSAPTSCKVRIHRRGCRSTLISVPLTRGKDRYSLEGTASMAVLVARPRRAGSATPRRRPKPTAPVLDEEGQEVEAEPLIATPAP